METLIKILLDIDSENVKNEFFLSKSDFLDCKKELENMRVAGYIGITGIPGIKTRSIFISENEIRFFFKGALIILTEGKKPIEYIQKDIPFEIDNEIEQEYFRIRTKE